MSDVSSQRRRPRQWRQRPVWKVLVGRAVTVATVVTTVLAFILVVITRRLHIATLPPTLPPPTPTTTSIITPIILIPGTGGSQLQAKIDKPSTVHFYCTKKSKDWFPLWLSVPSLLPGAIDCWCDNMKLLYSGNNSGCGNEYYRNNDGVQVRVGDGTFGGTAESGLEDLGWNPLVDALVNAGAVRNVTVRAAPYDFRYAPTSDEGNAYLSRLQTLIETTYAINYRTKVTLLSHSMGCLYTLYFFNHYVSSEWKTTYIQQWLPTSGVWAGAVDLMRLFASGNPEGIPGVHGSTIRDEQRSYPSNFWMLPSARIFGPHRVLATTPVRNFTATTMDDFFTTIRFPTGLPQLRHVANLTDALEYPRGVKTILFYGSGVSTVHTYVWSSDEELSNGADPVSSLTGDGDGTVPDLSLQAPIDMWNNKNHPHIEAATDFQAVEYAGMSHTGMLSNETWIRHIVSLVTLEVVVPPSQPTNQPTFGLERTERTPPRTVVPWRV